jgi:hypothetical protein
VGLTRDEEGKIAAAAPAGREALAVAGVLFRVSSPDDTAESDKLLGDHVAIPIGEAAIEESAPLMDGRYASNTASASDDHFVSIVDV